MSTIIPYDQLINLCKSGCNVKEDFVSQNFENLIPKLML